jgi:hypothetical protein
MPTEDIAVRKKKLHNESYSTAIGAVAQKLQQSRSNRRNRIAISVTKQLSQQSHSNRVLKHTTLVPSLRFNFN